jgi:antibiotic biosynthesis monooxygenase (ABM) superfamily enzyme
MLSVKAFLDLWRRFVISRVWHGWTKPENAAAYEAMLRSEILPGINRVPGFRGATLLRRRDGAEEEFVTITRFDDLDAVRAFAGDDYTRAVIAPGAGPLLTRYDEHSAHYETAFSLGA